jgi:hypothetical protein
MPGALVVTKIDAPAASGWAKLSEESVVADATLLAPAANASPIKIRFDGEPGVGVDWPAGVRADIGVQDLSRIEISGAEGDSIHLIARVGR